jgi:hypothetical protein
MRAALLVLLLTCGCVEGEAAKASRGDIFTSTSTGKRVDLHATPTATYLDARGRLAPGDYFFQVTDVTGRTLLSTDHISCRRFRIGEDGVIVHAYRGTSYTRELWEWIPTDCQHATGVDQEYAALSAITVRLAPFTATPKGEYSVWVTPIGDYLGNPNRPPEPDQDTFPVEPGVHGFNPATSRIEMFQVRLGATP